MAERHVKVLFLPAALLAFAVTASAQGDPSGPATAPAAPGPAACDRMFDYQVRGWFRDAQGRVDRALQVLDDTSEPGARPMNGRSFALVVSLYLFRTCDARGEPLADAVRCYQTLSRTHPADVPAMVADIRQRLERIRSRLSPPPPFLCSPAVGDPYCQVGAFDNANAYTQLETTAGRDVPEPAVGPRPSLDRDGGTVYLCSDFRTSETPAQRVDTLIHEAAHLSGLRHMPETYCKPFDCAHPCDENGAVMADGWVHLVECLNQFQPPSAAPSRAPGGHPASH